MEYVRRNKKAATINTTIGHLERLHAYLGQLPIDQIHNDHPMITQLKEDLLAGKPKWKYGHGHKVQERPRTLKTINSYLELIRRILRAAAYDWRDPATGKSWMREAPRLTLFPVDQVLDDQKPPYPISWDEQRELLKNLPEVQALMALFSINSGLRDRELTNLRFAWERTDVPPGCDPVFEIPGYWVDEVTGKRFKVTKNGQSRISIINSTCRSIIESRRQENPIFLFTWRGKKIGRATNSAWTTARTKAAKKYPSLANLHYHDLRHTFGHRLRAIGASDEDRDELLGQRAKKLSTHYSQADLKHLQKLCSKITKARKSAPVFALRSV